MKIIPLSEGTFTIDKTKQFVPFDDGTDVLKARPVGSLLVEIQPFVVITSKDVLLIDTGLGFSDGNGVMQLHKNLKEAGIDPGSITKVLMSHLHKDHAGAVSEDSDRSRLCFPGATYYVQERELDYALDKGLPSYLPEEIQALKGASNVVLLTEDHGLIDNYIEYQVTGAHSMFHQVFWIREEEEIIFFGADDAPQLPQMKQRYAAKYDHDGKKAMELRKQWWEKGAEEKWTFLFYHDFKTPVLKA
ncbi:MAG: MBL fold metallo-hydrolase [Chitinophagaceae bacterium]|nr:MAG: MBL fold metallo-hydrolase [Chitinophagaceae bacterium]